MKKKKQYNPIWQEKQTQWWYWFWGGVKEPWRPSKKEMKFFENIIKKLIKEKGKIEILIMGATPEFRDMLTKYKKARVTLLDLNPLVKKAMDKLRKTKNQREKFIIGDWMEMNKIFPEDYFDVVINDGGLENIKISKHDLIFRNVNKILKKDGYFLLVRACLEKFLRNPLTFKQVFDKYKKDPKFFRNFYNRLWYLYRLTFSKESKSYSYKEHAVKMSVLVREIMKRAKKENIKNPESLKWDPRIDYLFEYKEIDLESLKLLKTMIGKYFKIEKIYQDLFHPVMKTRYNFILKPKK